VKLDPFKSGLSALDRSWVISADTMLAVNSPKARERSCEKTFMIDLYAAKALE